MLSHEARFQEAPLCRRLWFFGSAQKQLRILVSHLYRIFGPPSITRSSMELRLHLWSRSIGRASSAAHLGARARLVMSALGQQPVTRGPSSSPSGSGLHRRASMERLSARRRDPGRCFQGAIRGSEQWDAGSLALGA